MRVHSTVIRRDVSAETLRNLSGDPMWRVWFRSHGRELFWDRFASSPDAVIADLLNAFADEVLPVVLSVEPSPMRLY